MQIDIKISYPASEKIYVSGKIHNIQVPMRRISLTDTVEIVNGERKVTSNSDIRFTIPAALLDPNIKIDLKKDFPASANPGLPNAVMWNN
jgi:phosphomethylpyrimidine synthase